VRPDFSCSGVWMRKRYMTAMTSEVSKASLLMTPYCTSCAALPGGADLASNIDQAGMSQNIGRAINNSSLLKIEGCHLAIGRRSAQQQCSDRL
jgi:hypothetical protein